MIITGVNLNIDVDLDEVLNEMDSQDKRELVTQLIDDDDMTASEVVKCIEDSTLDAEDVYDELDKDYKDEEEPEICLGIRYSDCHDPIDYLSKCFEKLSDYDKKKVLCNALWVPNYTLHDELRKKLEPIINAI